MLLAAILAHQGGWDEVVMVAVPVVVFAGLLALARRRAIKMAEAADAATPDTTD